MQVFAAGLAVLVLCSAGSAIASEKIATQAGCVACHAPARKIIGPSYREIALKYKGQAGAPKLLAERVRKGSTGVWGPVPMAATPAAKLSDADLKAVVAWLLQTP